MGAEPAREWLVSMRESFMASYGTRERQPTTFWVEAEWGGDEAELGEEDPEWVDVGEDEEDEKSDAGDAGDASLEVDRAAMDIDRAAPDIDRAAPDIDRAAPDVDVAAMGKAMVMAQGRRITVLFWRDAIRRTGEKIQHLADVEGVVPCSVWSIILDKETYRVSITHQFRSRSRPFTNNNDKGNHLQGPVARAPSHFFAGREGGAAQHAGMGHHT